MKTPVTRQRWLCSCIPAAVLTSSSDQTNTGTGGELAAGPIYYHCAQELCYTQAFGCSPQSNAPHHPFVDPVPHPPPPRPPPAPLPPLPPSPHSSVSGWKVQWGCGIPEGHWGRGGRGEGGCLKAELSLCANQMLLISHSHRIQSTRIGHEALGRSDSPKNMKTLSNMSPIVSIN